MYKLLHGSLYSALHSPYVCMNVSLRYRASVHRTNRVQVCQARLEGLERVPRGPDRHDLDPGANDMHTVLCSAQSRSSHHTGMQVTSCKRDLDDYAGRRGECKRKVKENPNKGRD